MDAQILTSDTTAQTIHDATEGNIRKIADIEESHRSNRPTAARLAEYITRFCGNIMFVCVNAAFFAGWIIYNTWFGAFDPFPFTFLTLMVSLEAILLSIFILISQNQERQMTERRNHLDLQINLLAEQENTALLELLHRIAEKLGVPFDDPAKQVLLEEMKPETLADQIVSVAEARNSEGGRIILP